MKICRYIFAALTLLPLPLSAQELKIPDAVMPKLPHSAPSVEAFVPAGWGLQIKAGGDLNGDSQPDVVFVLHQKDKRNILDNENGIGGPSIDTNPRLLCIAFRNTGGSGYTLAVQNATVIPRYTEPNMDDYFGDEGSLTVARGAFTVGLHFFANAGGWTAGDSTYTFRYQHQRFELIGFESKIVQRNSGEITNTSANLATGRVSIETGNVQDDKTHTRWKRLPVRPLRSIDEVTGNMEPDG